MFEAVTAQQIGLTVGGIGTIAFIVWQAWTKVRQQLKEDSKGDSIDKKIADFNNTLQQSAERLTTKLDTIQKENNDLVARCAQVSAELLIAKKEVADLTEEVEKHVARIRYLEDILKQKGVNYV